MACDLCGLAVYKLRTITCDTCGSAVHTTCLGLGRNAYSAGLFTCAGCVLSDVKVTHITEAARGAAHNLVRLRGQRVQASSQDTYASGLHRFVTFAVTHCQLDHSAALPPARQDSIPTDLVDLFISWAAHKYKVSTIRSTLSALADWHHAKGLPTSTVHNIRTRDLLRTVAVEQGSDGAPKGKTGLSKTWLMMLLVYLRDLASAQPQQAALCHRDRAWLALGFFGLLRRSELIALQMRDLQFVHHTSKPHLLVTIRRSKTDKVGAGQQVSLAHKTASGIGIWQLVHTWYQARLDQGASEGDPFLTAWDLDARAMGHKPLRTGEALANRLRAHLQSLKQKYPHLSLNVQSYAMHSLRRGGTVAAWEAGVDRDTIKGHGRWKSEVVQRYLAANLNIRLSLTARL